MGEWDEKKHLEFDIEMALMKSPHRVKKRQPTEVLRIMAKGIVRANRIEPGCGIP